MPKVPRVSYVSQRLCFKRAQPQLVLRYFQFFSKALHLDRELVPNIQGCCTDRQRHLTTQQKGADMCGFWASVRFQTTRGLTFSASSFRLQYRFSVPMLSAFLFAGRPGASGHLSPQSTAAALPRKDCWSSSGLCACLVICARPLNLPGLCLAASLSLRPV